MFAWGHLDYAKTFRVASTRSCLNLQTCTVAIDLEVLLVLPCRYPIDQPEDRQPARHTLQTAPHVLPSNSVYIPPMSLELPPLLSASPFLSPFLSVRPSLLTSPLSSSDCPLLSLPPFPPPICVEIIVFLQLSGTIYRRYWRNLGATIPSHGLPMPRVWRQQPNSSPLWQCPMPIFPSHSGRVCSLRSLKEKKVSASLTSLGAWQR